MTEDILAIATVIFLFVGGAFTLVGSIGLLKLRTPMARLHAPTKASTLGVGSLLLASILDSYVRGEPSLHEVLIMAFLFVTAPISAHFIAKVHIHRKHNKDALPQPEPDKVWATLEKVDEPG
ncbi:MAG: Na+/H+ antiporter subunit G [Rhodobacteraceae bacterium]|jgi:multicomponent K+:H+ antiporter subunit G|nr:Na+/H+ antiporter subunit G [Paracoccaceae bacterium]